MRKRPASDPVRHGLESRGASTAHASPLLGRSNLLTGSLVLLLCSQTRTERITYLTCKTMTIGGMRTTLCTPTVSLREKETVYCRDCKKQAKHITEVLNWYGFSRCCLNCGRIQTNDGTGWRYKSLPGGYDAKIQRGHNIKTWSAKPLITSMTKEKTK